MQLQFPQNSQIRQVHNFNEIKIIIIFLRKQVEKVKCICLGESDSDMLVLVIIVNSEHYIWHESKEM